MPKSKYIKKSQRPLLMISNSSWYLNHYRKLLIIKLKKNNQNVITLSPLDSSTELLESYSTHIPLRMRRNKQLNLFSTFFDFIYLTLLIKFISPKIIHSHTMKANLLISIISSIFGIKTIFSFAGLGSLSKSKGLKKILLIVVLKIIGYFSNFERIGKFKWVRNKERVKFIFQNPNDKKFFENHVSFFPVSNCSLILGSGVPMHYFSSNKKNYLKGKSWLNKVKNNPRIKVEFIYCGRLLKSKGIILFKDLAKNITHQKFTVFGEIDNSSSDSISSKDISIFEKNNLNLNFKGAIKDPLINYKFKNLPIIVVPSNYGEGLSRTIVEALSLGIPIICSKSSSKGIFTNDYLYISKSNNKKDYEECYKQIIKDYYDGILESKLKVGMKVAKRFFSEQVIVDKTYKLYLTLDKETHNSYLIKKDLKRSKNWLPT
tara:strand:- start:939 stop:2231 length:1293 start_codon:yes stop_codon:yes gene_type:complete